MLLLFVIAGFSSLAQSIIGPDYVYVNTSKSSTGATTTYGALNGGNAPGGTFQGNLGSYALGNGNASDEQLLFNGGTVVTSEPTNSNPSVRFRSAQLNYRIYLLSSGSTGVPFAALDLPEDVAKTVVNGATTTRTFTLDNASIDLIGAVSGPGTYVIELNLQANFQNGNTITPVTPSDNRNGSNYVAVFDVTGTRGNTTVWNGGISDNWFDANNWSDGVPTATKDAFIRYPNPGATVPYPRIYANGSYQPPTNNTTFPAYPTPNGTAVVRSLSFGGASATARATTELVTGNLFIYGNFTNNFDNITQDANTVITFAGTTNAQTLDGGGAFKTVCISGGSQKNLTGNMKIATELHFGPPTDLDINAGLTLPTISGKAILAVNGSNSNNVVTLQAIPNTSGVANITGETDAGYVLGLVNTQAPATPGITQSFGNIGLDLLFTGNSPGLVAVNRVIGQYYSGTNTSNPSSVSIRRSFEVNPSNTNTTTGGLNATLVFHYLDGERNSGPSNSVTVSEAQLYLAYSNNSTSFSAIGTTDNRNPSANTVTTSGVTSFAIFTLADVQNPLPVSLVAFNAKRLGDNALITWATAMERNNRGFEVEVSTDGTTFRTLGFVASNSPDSNKHLDYTFTDTEANKSGIRYYRLHQLDISGKDDYSPVRAVSFAAAGENVVALSAYPNPFSSDEIKLALQSSEAGQASLRLTDLMGRQVSAQTFAAVKGVTEVSIDQASQLAAGSYLAQVTAPSGEVKTVRIQKR